MRVPVRSVVTQYPRLVAWVGALAVLYASGVGTDALELPDGVAVKIPAGKQILLNLHLFNASDTPLEGTSGIEVNRIEPEKIQHEADMIGRAGHDLVHRRFCLEQMITAVEEIYDEGARAGRLSEVAAG